MDTTITRTRTCRSCGEAKPPEAFGRQAGRCRECDRERLRELDEDRRWNRRAERLLDEPDWRDLSDSEFFAKYDRAMTLWGEGADAVAAGFPAWWDD
jgi:hypothetical protein